MEVVQGVQNGYTVLNLEMNKVQQCNSCILNTLHHGIIMMSDNNGIPDNNGKIKDNNKKIPWGRGWGVGDRFLKCVGDVFGEKSKILGFAWGGPTLDDTIPPPHVINYHFIMTHDTCHWCELCSRINAMTCFYQIGFVFDENRCINI